MPTPSGPDATLSGAAFPATRHSVLAAVRSTDAEVRARALDTLAAAYWRPVYKHLRLRWRASPQDAEDLTQGFFARALERALFDRYDPEQARLRTWLRTCLDSYVANQRKAAGRLKRGGGAVLVPLDVPGAERELEASGAAASDDPEVGFEREWVRSLFTLALERLRARCQAAGKLANFELFERYDVDGPGSPGRVTYRQLAEEQGIPVTQVTNHLAVVRRWFREGVLELLREISGSEAEFRAEARALLGVDPP